MDKLSASARSEQMRKVRSVDTKPELAVRRIAHGLGFRFRLHPGELPGSPDLVFPRLRKVIFVHGCFWHGHSCRAGRNQPASNTDYWAAKLERNRRRDRMAKAQLRGMGWRVAVLWECQIRKETDLARRLRSYLDS